jgi:hypothetical protein
MSDRVVVYWGWTHTYIPDSGNGYDIVRGGAPLISDLKNFDLERLSKRIHPMKFFGSSAAWCPAMTDELKRTFALRSNLDLHFKTNSDSKKVDILDSEVFKRDADALYDAILYIHKAEDGDLVNLLHTKLVFYCEEDMTMTMLPAYYDQNDFTKNVMGLSGTFNINKWIRPASAAFKLKRGCNEVKISAGDAMCYFKFNTDKRVILQKFDAHPLQEKVLDMTMSHSYWHAPKKRFLPLKDIYDAWIRNRYGNRAIKVIKENLLD